MFEKDPVAFYDKMMTQEMLMVKARFIPKTKKGTQERVEFTELT
jgi:hypothetical protein